MTRRTKLMLLVFALMASSAIADQKPAPIALHPENPHYFTWRNQPTILITSGEHYGALLNLDFDYVRYLDELESKGLNHTRTFSGVYREVPSSFRITDNPLAPKPNRYICSVARTGQPGYYDGGAKFDLFRWDQAYFKRLKDFMTSAQQRGVVVELTLFCPMYNEELWRACPMNAANNVNGIGDCPRDQIYILKHKDLLDIQLTFTKKVVSELHDFDNLYYEVCNEPYQRRSSLEWQYKIVDTIVETEKDFPAKHLISLNIANGREEIKNPHPAVSIFNFHYCVPPDTVAMNYDLNKVIGENETGFRGRHDVLYRTEGWDFLLAGGALYNNLDYSFTPAHPSGTFLGYKSPGGGSPPLRQQLQILKQFLYGFDFVHMTPDNSVISKVSPALSASALVEQGNVYAVYLHVPIPNKPKDISKHLRKNIEAKLELKLPPGHYKAEWIDTRQGMVALTTEFSHDRGHHTLTSPRFSNDIALRMARMRNQ